MLVQRHQVECIPKRIASQIGIFGRSLQGLHGSGSLRGIGHAARDQPFYIRILAVEFGKRPKCVSAFG